MQQRISGRGCLAVLACIVGIGFLLRVWGLDWGLSNANVSRRVHPDEWVLYWLFQWFGGSTPLNPCPRAQGACFFDWGAVFPYSAYMADAVVSPVIGLLPPHTFGAHADLAYVSSVVAGRIVSLIFSTATIVVAYHIGSRAFGRSQGLLAALLVALSGLLVQLAHFATPDSMTVFLMSLTLLAGLWARESHSVKAFAAAGVALGASAANEYHMALLAVPVAFAWYLGPRRSPGRLALAFACAIATFVLSNPYVIPEFPAFLAAIEHTLRVRTVDSSIQYENRWASYGPAWLYVTRYALGFGVGYALTVWMVVGVLWAFFRRSAATWVLLSWLLPYFLLVSASPAKFVRYAAPLIVPLAVLAAAAAVDVATRLQGRTRVAVGSLALLCILYSSSYDAAYAGLFASADPRAVAASWVAQHVRTGQEIAFEAPPDGLVDLPDFLAGDGVRACFARRNLQSLLGADFVITDEYTSEEYPQARRADLMAFQHALATDGAYVAAVRVRYVPTFLGLRFPIDASPHDWRYPSHEIVIYRRVVSGKTSRARCFASLTVAEQALHVRAPRK